MISVYLKSWPEMKDHLLLEIQLPGNQMCNIFHNTFKTKYLQQIFTLTKSLNISSLTCMHKIDYMKTKFLLTFL